MTSTADLSWHKPETLLPVQEDFTFGWSEAVLVYDPQPDREDFYVGAYSYVIERWQVCETSDYRGCEMWCYLTVPTP